MSGATNLSKASSQMPGLSIQGVGIDDKMSMISDVNRSEFDVIEEDNEWTAI
jgi:hypothetical protein